MTFPAGFLNPLFLAAAAAVAVPVILHLFHRHRSRRVPFPALRYLQRTEREHARRIRLRQILLLVVRCTAIVLVVLAGARLFLSGRGGEHEPTALAIVLDNSLSTGLVDGGSRVFDGLRARALATLERAGPEDRIWILRAGDPSDVAVPTGVAGARRRVEGTEVTDAGADLSSQVARARSLVTSAGLHASEIHLLSDLRITSLRGDGIPGGGSVDPVASPAPPEREARDARDPVPLLAWLAGAPEPVNRHVAGVLVGGGLPPVAHERTRIAAELGVSNPVEGLEPVAVRLVVDGRVRDGAAARPGETLLLSAGPFSRGPVSGWIETDPDALGADDRRYFAFDVRSGPGVALTGGPNPFLEGALDVLVESGRARRVEPDGADVVIALAGDGLRDAPDGATRVVVPPDDPTLLPATNRRLADAGIPWRLETAEPGEVELAESRLPLPAGSVRVSRHYRLRPSGPGPPSAEIPARLTGGAPLVVSGRAGGEAWVVLATPLDPAWTELPLTAHMIAFTEWLLSRSDPGPPVERTAVAGRPIPVATSATAVLAPDGTRHPVDGTHVFRATARSGLYTVLAGDSAVERIPVNPPSGESELRTAGRAELHGAFGDALVVVDDPADWDRAVFRARRGPEAWRPLLVAALLLLLAESGLAAAGRSGSAARR